jgi:hypothetical protein
MTNKNQSRIVVVEPLDPVEWKRSPWPHPRPRPRRYILINIVFLYFFSFSLCPCHTRTYTNEYCSNDHSRGNGLLRIRQWLRFWKKLKIKTERTDKLSFYQWSSRFCLSPLVWSSLSVQQVPIPYPFLSRSRPIDRSLSSSLLVYRRVIGWYTFLLLLLFLLLPTSWSARVYLCVLLGFLFFQFPDSIHQSELRDADRQKSRRKSMRKEKGRESGPPVSQAQESLVPVD